MCGIVGAFVRTGIVNIEDVAVAVAILNHRGPDSQSIWISENQDVALGHARLSIIDLINGTQPFSSFDNTVHAVINGELYDYSLIKKELEAKGHKFKTSCDGEILVALYLEYGLNLFEYLRGEFSFMLWDSKGQKLIAARDQMGVKPLYYSLYKNNIYIASEIKALLKFDLPAIWNKDFVYYNNHNIYYPTQTCFNNIFSLNPGFFLIVSKNDFNVRQYWAFDFPREGQQVTNKDEECYIAEFRTIFEDAVKIRLNSDVPVGCYLSGGIDSTSVLAIASKLSRKPIKTFTISFEDRMFDEAEIAKNTALFLGAEYTEIKVADKDLAENFSASIWHGEAMVANTHGVALFMLSKLAKDNGYKVVLTGGGSDELLAGYSFFKEDLISSLENLMPFEKEAILKLIRSSPIGAGLVTTSKSQQVDDLIVSYIKGRDITLLKMYSGRGHEFSSLYSNGFTEAVKNRNAILDLLEFLDLGILENLDAIGVSTYLFAKTTLPGYILSTIGDRMEMAHSIEGRVPFLDKKLVDFNIKLPSNLKLKWMTEKYILREAVKDIIPRKLYERTKQPFCAPPANQSLMRYMREVFNSDLLKHSPFYAQKKVLQLLESIPRLSVKERVASDSILTEVLSSCLLQGHYALSNASSSEVDFSSVNTCSPKIYKLDKQ